MDINFQFDPKDANDFVDKIIAAVGITNASSGYVDSTYTKKFFTGTLPGNNGDALAELKAKIENDLK